MQSGAWIKSNGPHRGGMSADFPSVPYGRIISAQGKHTMMGNLHRVISDNDIFEACLWRLAEFRAEVIEDNTACDCGRIQREVSLFTRP